MVLVVALFLVGCMPIRYVTQAAAGQELLNRQGVDIETVVREERLDKRTRQLLAHVRHIKAFGESYGLRQTKNYERYIRLDRPAVVWVVSACDPVAFRPRVWRFPIVGSITYSGWFDRAEAKTYAEGLAKEGWDVDLRPSQAYSTLGWFDDPILSTMISPESDALGELADVVLHETLHATFYVPNQSTLNESVASFVGDELAVRYLDATLGPDSDEKARFLEGRRRGERRGRLMKSAYEALDALYRSARPRAEKLTEKAQIIAQLTKDTGIKRPLTNATLIQYKTYGSGKAELAALLDACGGDFLKTLRGLDALRRTSQDAPPHSDPAELLRPLVEAGCP
jgi:predicted aminopeptidase